MPLVTKQITIGPQAVGPGESAQISFSSPEDGRLKTPALGEGARPIKLWAGKETSMPPEDGAEWEVDLPARKGGLIMLSIQNMLNEPALFSARFPLEVNAPEEAPKAGDALTQRIPKESELKTTPADHGLREGHNEVGVCFMRNEANFLIAHLREGHPLPPDVKNTVVRRLDAVLKVKK